MTSTSRIAPLSVLWNPAAWEPWRRNEWAISLAIGVNFLAINLSTPFFPRYVRELGVGDPGRVALWSGMLAGVGPLLNGLLAPFWARVAERTSNGPMLLRSLVASALFVGLQGASTSVWHLLILRVLLGLFSGINGFAPAVISVTVPEDRVTRAVGILQSMQYGGTAVGMAIGGTLADMVGPRCTLFVAGGFGAATAVLFLRLFDTAYDRTLRPRRDERMPLSALVRLPGLLAVIVLLFGVGLAEKSFAIFIPLYVQELHAPTHLLGTISGAVYVLWAATGAAATYGAGRLGRQQCARALLIAALAGGIVILLLLAGVRRWWQLLALMPLYPLLAAGVPTLAYAIAARLVPSQDRVMALSTLGGAAMLGTAVGPVMGGGIVGVAGGLRAAFVAAAALFAALLLIAWRGVRLPGNDPGASGCGCRRRSCRRGERSL